MEYFNGKRCVTYEELTNGIVTECNYRNLTNRKKITVVRRACYGTTALIDFESLPTNIREAYIRMYGNPNEHIKKSTLKDYIEIDPKAEQYFANYKLADGRHLTIETQKEYCTNAKFLRAIHLAMNDQKASIKALGNGLNKRNLWQERAVAVELMRNEHKHTLPSCERRLKEKVQEFNKQGYECLVSKKYLNKNSVKVEDAQQEALLRRLMSDHRNLDNEQIKKLYGSVAVSMDWKEITASTVANYREKWNLFIIAGSKGEQTFNNTKAMLVKRSAPTYPLYYWTMDGWDVELLYQGTGDNDKGYNVTTYHNRLTAVIVLDPSVKYIAGYAIGRQESPGLIKQALRNAVKHTGELFGAYHKPLQLQSDNYQKKALASLYEAVTKHYTPARVKNAKAKVIEPFFKYLNKNYCQMQPNWSGFGVTTSKNRQPNGEYLSKIKHSFPDQAGCAAQIVAMIEADRALKVEGFKALYAEMPQEDKLLMGKEEFLYALGETTGYTNRISAMGLVPTIEGVKKEYDSYDRRFRELAFTDWTVMYDPSDTTEVLATSADGTQRFLLTEKYVQPMALREREEGDALELKKLNDYNKVVKTEIIVKMMQDADNVEQLFNENPALNDTLTKFMITDSRGQHKDNKSAARLNKEAKKVVAKQLRIEAKQEERTFKEQTDDYLRQKVNASEYL